MTKNQLLSVGLCGLVLVYAAVLFDESQVHRQLESAQSEQARLKTKISEAQSLVSISQQLLKRMTVESQTDMALAEVLKKNGVHLGSPAIPEGHTASPDSNLTNPISHANP